MAGGPRRSSAAEGPRRSIFGRFVWTLFLLVDVPLLLLVAAGWGAGYLHPDLFWWAQLCAAFLPYLAVALGMAAVYPLLVRRWGWFALHALVLVVVVSRSIPADVFDNPVDPQPDDLVMMTFNVPQVGPSAEVLGDSVAALAASVQPDLVALQETILAAPLSDTTGFRFVGPQAQALMDSLGFGVPAIRWDTRFGPPFTEVPILARTVEDSAMAMEAEEVVMGAVDQDNVTEAVRLQFRWQGRPAVLYGVHLRSYGVPKPWQDPALDALSPRTWLPYLRGYRDAYRARALEVERLVERIAAETAPVIVAGDFNEGPFSWAYRQIRDAGTRRADAFLAAGEGDGRTYHARRPVVRIDYVLADPAFEVVSARVRATTFSDHRPVVVRLRWRAEG